MQACIQWVHACFVDEIMVFRNMIWRLIRKVRRLSRAFIYLLLVMTIGNDMRRRHDGIAKWPTATVFG